jgi:hypothetical protein
MGIIQFADNTQATANPPAVCFVEIGTLGGVKHHPFLPGNLDDRRSPLIIRQIR